MKNNYFAKILNFEDEWSPSRKSSKRQSGGDEMKMGSSSAEQKAFGSLAHDEEKGCVSPVPTRTLTFGSLAHDEEKGGVSSVVPLKPDLIPFVQKYYGCSPITHVKSAGSLDPLNQFCLNLANDKVLTELPEAYPQPTSQLIADGSTSKVYEGTSLNTVEKIANVGSNTEKNLDPKSSNRANMTKTDLLALFDAIRRSHGNPQVVKTFEMYLSHVSKDNGVLTIVQDKCFPLPKNMAGLLGLIQCVIALHRSGLPVSDVKYANFMISSDGSVVCVDLDLRKSKKGVYKIVASGEYTHCVKDNVSPQFQQLLLVVLETLGHPIVGDRKPAFRALYEEKGLLQGYSLLSSDRSVFETTIDDFAEVLRNIGLSEEDIAYLVGLIVPLASSQ